MMVRLMAATAHARATHQCATAWRQHWTHTVAVVLAQCVLGGSAARRVAGGLVVDWGAFCNVCNGKLEEEFISNDWR